MALVAAGTFRRTSLERADQRVSWDRADQPFFASGACHILAWTCRESHLDRGVGLAGMRTADEPTVFHVWATWGEWAFDHAGWHRERDLLAVNSDFEGETLARVALGPELARFCDEHRSRMPHQYWADPAPRARRYLDRFRPPWQA